MNRIGKGLGSLLLLGVLLVGIPAGLIVFAGNPLPTMAELQAAFTMPDYTGSFLAGTILPIAAWIAWATFALGFLAELPSQLRGRPRARIPLLGVQQKIMGALLAAVIALFSPAAAFATAVPTSAPVASASITSVAVASDESAAQTTIEAGPEYVVQASDTLYRIAESTMGDRGRWTDIAQLNYGIVQADGGSLDSTHWVQEGWVLTLPADAVVAAPEVAAADAATAAETVTQITYEQRVIVSGDTLWDIAQERLGDGNRYPEIFEASKSTIQPDGRTLTDPDWIYPGWTVRIPVVTTVPVAPPASGDVGGAIDPSAGATDSDEAADAGAAADEGAGGAEGAAGGAASGGETGTADEGAGLGFTTETSPQPATEEDQVPAAAENVDAADADEQGIEDYFNVATIGGIGGILAAGLLTLLGFRRLAQRRNRKPRQRIAMPDETLATVELELRAVENPLGAEAVDTALRHLALWAQETGERLPSLYALRLDESSVAVYLDEPTDLPAPFTQYDPEDKLAWMVALTDLEPLDTLPSAPYPALVMLGHDDGDGHLFVDLERIGALNVTGTSEEQRRGVLTAIALELASNTWSGDVQITLVGVGDRLPLALGSGRVRHVDDTDTLLRNLRGQAAAVEKALAELGVEGLEQARTSGVDAEAWAPEIIILGNTPDRETCDAISELVTRIPRVGIAAVSSGDLAGGWTLALTEDRRAQLEIPAEEPVAIPLTPQTVGTREYEEILALFDVATEGAPTGEAVDDEPALDDLPAAEAADDVDELTVDDEVTAPDEIHEEAAAEDPLVDAEVSFPAPMASEAGELVDDAPAEVEEQPEVPEEAGEESLAAVTRIHRGPYLQLLGPVEVRGARGDAPVNPNTAAQWRSAIRRGTELVAFLSVTPNATAEQVHAVFWPGQVTSGKKANDDRNGLLSKTRRWLGQDDHGEYFVPYITTGEYRLHPDVRSDWNDFLELVGDDISTASIENLTAALELVKGQPISGVPDKRYVFADRLRNEMIATIGDVAHEVARRNLTAGKVRGARMASAIGRMVDAVNEVFWRDGLRAEHQAGDVAGVERLVTQLEQTLVAIDEDYEPEAETQALIAQLRRRHAIAS